MTRLALPALFLASSLSAAPQDPSSAPRSVETYPVTALVERLLQPLPPPLTTFTQAERFPELSDEPVGIGADVLLDVLREMRAPDIASGRLELDIRHEMLLARGEPGTVVDVGRDLEQLAAVLTRPIAIEAALYERAADVPSDAILSPEGVAALRRASPIWTATAMTRSGHAAALGQGRWTRFVRDLEAQVSQKASIMDPQVDAFFEGIRLAIEPHALSGTDDIALFCHFVFGWRRGPVERRATVPNQPSIDVPRLDFNTGQMSGRIVDQGGLALTVDGTDDSGSRRVLVVSARHATPRTESPGQLRLYPVSALTTTALTSRCALPRHYPGANDQQEMFGEPEPERSYGSADAEELLGIVGAALEGIVPQEQLRTLRWIGPFVAARGPAETLARVEATLQWLQERWLRNSEVRARTRLLPGTAAPVRSEPTADEAVDLHLLVFPALLGRRHVVNRGIETVVIGDYHARIAQDSSALKPIALPVFSGLSIAVRPHASVRGIGADVLVDVTSERDPVRREAENAQAGELELLSTERARFRRQHDWPAPGDVVLGAGPNVAMDGRTWRTQQELRITPR